MIKSGKMLRNPYSSPFLETPNRPPNIKCIVPAFFGNLFGLKKMAVGAHTNPSAEEVRRFEVFLYEADQNFEHRLKV
jgi:hypothetical protein